MRMADEPADGLAVVATTAAPGRGYRISHPDTVHVLAENGLPRGTGFYAAPVEHEHGTHEYGPGRYGAQEHVTRQNGRQEQR